MATKRPLCSYAGEVRELDAADSLPSAPGAISFSTVEVNLGSSPERQGRFSITSSGLAAGKPVFIRQSVGPYTGKGTQADEVEMDDVQVAGKTTSTTNIACYWKSRTFVRGNFKFDYAVGA